MRLTPPTGPVIKVTQIAGFYFLYRPNTLFVHVIFFVRYL